MSATVVKVRVLPEPDVGVGVNVGVDVGVDVIADVGVCVGVDVLVGVAVGGTVVVVWITSCGRLLLASRLLKFMLEPLVVVRTRS